MWLLNQTYKSQRLALVKDFLPSWICKMLIEFINTYKFDLVYEKQRLELDLPELAKQMWGKTNIQQQINELNQKKIIDEFGDEWVATGLNPHFRFIKYDKGQNLYKHCDGFFEETATKKTMASLTTYLNTIPEENGGETLFTYSRVKIRPTEGCAMLIWIDDELEHEALPIEYGTKYICRTDIFYECKNPKEPEIRQKVFELRKKIDKNDDDLSSNDIDSLWMSIITLEEQMKIDLP